MVISSWIQCYIQVLEKEDLSWI